MKYLIAAVLLVIFGAACFAFVAQDPERAEKARERMRPLLAAEFAALAKPKLQFSVGNPVLIRILKEERVLELWIMPDKQNKMTLFKTYPIKAMSGTLGPKTKEGDCQAPEGFYATTKQLLNPKSQYHLAMNIGYPNAYDRSKKRTGSFIMIHGKAASIGCFAMGDPAIEEIFVLSEAALINGQKSVPVYIFPFKMTDENMKKHAGTPHDVFWKNLHTGWNLFESSRAPLKVSVKNGIYIFETPEL